MTLASFAYNRLVDGSVRWLIPSIVKYLPYSVTECRGQSSNRLCCSDNLDDPLGTGCKVRNRGGERVRVPYGLPGMTTGQDSVAAIQTQSTFDVVGTDGMAIAAVLVVDRTNPLLKKIDAIIVGCPRLGSQADCNED